MTVFPLLLLAVDTSLILLISYFFSVPEAVLGIDFFIISFALFLIGALLSAYFF